MITGKKLISIVDVKTIYDKVLHKNIQSVVSGKNIVCTVDLVGIQTAKLGQIQGMNFAYSVEVSRMQYDEEKYLYFENELYEIKTMTKAKLQTNMLLNIVELNNEEIKTAIEEWKNASI